MIKDAAYALAIESLAAGMHLRVRVNGRSMFPLIRPGDALVIEKVEGAQCHQGDIIVYQRGTDMVTHRLLQVGDEECITKGDHALHVDRPVLVNDILGRVVMIDHLGRKRNLGKAPWIRIGRLWAILALWECRVTKKILGSVVKSEGKAPGAWRRALAWLSVIPWRLPMWFAIMVWR